MRTNVSDNDLDGPDAEDIDQEHAWSISARLAAVPEAVADVPQSVGALVAEALGLHPRMAPRREADVRPVRHGATAARRMMAFAMERHATQVRKYTGEPYVTHLAQVAGTVAALGPQSGIDLDVMIAVAWGHDLIEDQGVTFEELDAGFGGEVAAGIRFLTDAESGARPERKAAARNRLAAAPGWVQTIKVADLISNTASIRLHDAKFAAVYVAEVRLLIGRLVLADPDLVAIAHRQLEEPAGVVDVDFEATCLPRPDGR